MSTLNLITCLQVKHLLTVETDEGFAARKAAEAAARAPREPVRVIHKHTATQQ